MSGVRVLVGTRKGAFVLTSDAMRGQWEIAGPPVVRLGDTPSEGIISGDRIQLQQVILPLAP